MFWFKGVLIVSLVFFALPLFADASSSESQFELEKDLVEKIFRSSSEEQGAATTSSGFTVSPGLSVVTFSKLALRSPYFVSNLAEQVGSIPSFQLTFNTGFFRWSDILFSGDLRLGYGFKESVFQVVSSTGSAFSDLIRLHWLPFSLSSVIEYQPSAISFLSLMVKGGIGTQWISQSGRLDGISQNFWAPFIVGGAGIRVGDLSQNGKHWFGGVLLSATVAQGLVASPEVGFSSLDLAVVFHL